MFEIVIEPGERIERWLYLRAALRSTAGVTGKGGSWQTKPPDAESASWGSFPESAAERPHLSGARGVGQVLQDAFDFEIDIPVNHCIYR